MLLALEITRLDFTSFLLLGDYFRIGFALISTMMRVLNGIIAAYGREEAKMLQILYLHQCLLVECYTKIVKETI